MKKDTNVLNTILYNFIYPACVYFSVSIFLFTAITYIMEYENLAPTIKTQVLFWIFSAGMALLQNIFRIKILNIFFRVLIHYIGMVVLFILILVILTGQYNDSLGGFILIIVLSVIYFFIASIVLLIRAFMHKSSNTEKKYDSLYRR